MKNSYSEFPFFAEVSIITMKKKPVAVVVICSFMLVVLLIVNFAVSTFFHYYSMISVKNQDDYSDMIITRSDAYLSEIADVSIELPEQKKYSSDYVTNILLIGTDERTEKFNKASRADSIMLMSLNQKTNEVKLVSFERDTYVAIPKVPRRNPDKLGHTFSFGGAPLLMETLGTHFGLDVDRYIRVNFSVFVKLIDKIGGVDINLTKIEAGQIYAHIGTIVREGTNHLNGETALFYSRMRKIDSDWNRVKRQQNVIIAIKKGFSQKSAGELKEIFDECLPYIQTNLTASECVDLLLNISDYANGDVKQMTLPDRKTFSSLKKVNFLENSEILRSFLYD